MLLCWWECVMPLKPVTYQNLYVVFCGSNYLPGQSIFLFTSAIFSERTMTFCQDYVRLEYQIAEREDSETGQQKYFFDTEEIQGWNRGFLRNGKVSVIFLGLYNSHQEHCCDRERRFMWANSSTAEIEVIPSEKRSLNGVKQWESFFRNFTTIRKRNPRQLESEYDSMKSQPVVFCTHFHWVL